MLNACFVCSSTTSKVSFIGSSEVPADGQVDRQVIASIGIGPACPGACRRRPLRARKTRPPPPKTLEVGWADRSRCYHGHLTASAGGPSPRPPPRSFLAE